MLNLYVLSSSWLFQRVLARFSSHKHNFSNTTNNIQLNKVFIVVFIALLFIIALFFLYRLIVLMNNNNFLFIALWSFIQLVYFIIGFINCFGFKPDKKFVSSPIYAHTHDLFFLTLLYIIANLLLLYMFNTHCINVNDRLSSNDIPDIIEMISLIIAVISITLSHHISSVSCMGILTIVFISVQLGLFGLYPNFINNNNNNNNNNDDNDNNVIITQQNNMTIMQQQNNN